MKKTLVLALSALALFSCESKWEKEYKAEQQKKLTFKAAVEAELGTTLTQMKVSGTGAESYIVYKDAATGEFIAVNYTKFVDGMTSFYIADADDIVRNMDQKSEWTVSGYNEDITEQRQYTDYEWQTKNSYDFQCSCYRDEQVYVPVTKWETVKIGERWVDTSGYKFYYYGGGFRFENTSGGSKDLDAYAAIREEASQGKIADRFKSEFSLSSDRAKELANLTAKYMKLENTRALTKSEKDHFATKSLGVSMNQIETAMRSRAMGYDAEYDALLKQAAQVNKTTPEMIGKFFEQVVE